MTFKEIFEKEKNVVVRGQSVRFRIVKYSILLPLFALLWWWKGWYISLQVVGALFIVSLGVHFFYRYMTAGWTKPWGGFRPDSIQ